MLYLVSTPIGNLGDITLRALETLREVDVVASEDTRKTGILLRHFDIKKPQISFHEHNEAQAGARIQGLIEQGRSVALVTSAGTPSISDPGFTLVRRMLNAGNPVTAIPGPAAFVLALVVSGLAVHSFTFRGFAPRKSGPRRRFLAIDARAPHTLIFYESPYRVKSFLEDALAVFGDRRGAIANDLTKKFERVERGTLSELIEVVETTKPRGEYTIVIAGLSREEQPGAGEREFDNAPDDEEEDEAGADGDEEEEAATDDKEDDEPG